MSKVGSSGLCIAVLSTSANMQVVLPPISTKGLTPADVDTLAQNTRQAMLKTLVGMAHKNEHEVDAKLQNASSTAVEI